MTIQQELWQYQRTELSSPSLQEEYYYFLKLVHVLNKLAEKPPVGQQTNLNNFVSVVETELEQVMEEITRRGDMPLC